MNFANATSVAFTIDIDESVFSTYGDIKCQLSEKL